MNSLIDFLSCCKLCCKRVKTAYTEIYREGSDRIEKHLDIIKLINDIKFMKLMIKYAHRDSITENLKFQIRHCKKSVLDLDKMFKEDNKDE